MPTLKCVLLLLPLICLGQLPNVAPDVASAALADPHSTLTVIVQFASPPGPSENANIHALGGNPQQADLSLIQAALYSIPADAIAGLAHNPNVTYISLDRNVAATLDYANPTVGAPSSLAAGWNGTGVGVAIIDSGILAGTDLLDKSTKAANISRVVYSESFIPRVTKTVDEYGHGTHVAGIVGGNGTKSSGSAYFKTFLGIAPNAKVINLRVLDANGAGTDSAVIGAINKAIQLRNTYNIRVINLSLGRPVFESYLLDPLCQAVERAWNAGMVVIVAAGNEGRNRTQGTDGYATITAPANDPLVITVGAMKTNNTPARGDDLIASYSSKGPSLIDHVVKPDIVAPGNRTVSLVASKTLVVTKSTTVNKVPYNYYQTTQNTTASADYYRLSGTSMAAPMVSGTAALMLEKEWSLTPDTIKARLMKTATKAFPLYSDAVDPVTGVTYTSQYDIFTVGAGYLDSWAALNNTDFVPAGSTAASPNAVADQDYTVRVNNSSTAIWGVHAVWGTTDVWGVTAVWGTGAFVDGQTAVWGTSAVWGNHAVWGTGGTTGNTAVWGTHAVWGTTTNDGAETLSLLINGEN